MQDPEEAAPANHRDGRRAGIHRVESAVRVARRHRAAHRGAAWKMRAHELPAPTGVGLAPGASMHVPLKAARSIRWMAGASAVGLWLLALGCAPEPRALPCSNDA